MIPISLSPAVVWKGHYSGDLSELVKRASHKLKTGSQLNTRVERDGGISSSSDPDAPHYWEESNDFLVWAGPMIEKVWAEWQLPTCDLSISSSWVNLHPFNGWTDEHTHGSVPLVCVLYVEQPANGGNLEIFDPMFHTWSGSLRVELPWKEIKVRTGDVLMFPGWMLHKTQKNSSNDDRIVMSINISPNPHTFHRTF